VGLKEHESELFSNSPNSLQRCIKAATQQSWFSSATLAHNNESKRVLAFKIPILYQNSFGLVLIAYTPTYTYTTQV
jgi:hypothetical protein